MQRLRNQTRQPDGLPLDRLAFDVLTLPPLRERGADVMLLAEHFAVGMTNELNREYFPGFSKDAKLALEDYSWPGNVRELKNVIERCVYRNEEDKEISEVVFDPFDSPYRPEGKSDTIKPKVAALPLDLKQTVQEFEIELLNRGLSEAKHNQRKAAELLKLTYHQLRGYLKKYELLKSD